MVDPAPTFDKKPDASTPMYKPFRPFGRGTTLLRGLINHGYHQLQLPLRHGDLSMGSASKANDRRARERLGVRTFCHQPLSHGFPKTSRKNLTFHEHVGCLIGILMMSWFFEK